MHQDFDGRSARPQATSVQTGGRLVVVSNRVVDPQHRTSAGGLAVALAESLQRTGGLWFGWSGQVAADGEPPTPRTSRWGDVSLCTLDLSQADHDAYYLGYANSVLWPVFHNRLDLAALERGDLEGYRRVNRLFAQHLVRQLRPDDVIWVHDYHLIPLAAELRALGCRQRIGFFLHIPLPPPLLLAAIPQHEWLIRSLFAYDLVGLQSETDLAHFARYVRHEGRAEQKDQDLFEAFGRSVRARAIPIGIDVDEFQALGRGREALDMAAKLRAQHAGKALLVGVDRLDYSKGLPQRLRAFRRLLQAHPSNTGRTVLLQVAAPSREAVGAYAELRAELEALSGQINSEHGDIDWTPVRYLHRAVARGRLPGMFACARVAMVTPLRDGMNLVAKEYVAAQNPADPGVLVLSRFAGAAEQMTDALLVNPYDIEGVAQTTQLALDMSLDERRIRHQRLLASICTQDVHWWQDEFLKHLLTASTT